MAFYGDSDAQETQEWQDALTGVIEHEGTGRAHFLIQQMIAQAREEGIDIPEPVSLDDYSGQFKLRIPKSLHHALATHAKEEGISMNQYCVYLLTKNDTLSHA